MARVSITQRPKKPVRKKCEQCKIRKPLTQFYVSNSSMFVADKRVPICKECCKLMVLNSDGTIDFPKFNALLVQLDKPLYLDSLDIAYQHVLGKYPELNILQVESRGYDLVSKYFTLISAKRDKDKTYKDSQIEGFVRGDDNGVSETDKEAIVDKYAARFGSILAEVKLLPGNNIDPIPVEVSEKDIQNKSYVLSITGYNPFDGIGFSYDDEKYCFNVLSGYCDIEGIKEDSHKLQAAIELSMLYAQSKNLTQQINTEMNKTHPDETRVQKLTSSKTNVLNSIATLAKDNNIASNYNKNAKQGIHSLSAKMKEMSENDFEAIKINFFDVKTSEAFKQIDEISNTNIANQLTLDQNEYASIVKEQRELIQSLTKERDSLQEEKRLLENRLLDMTVGTQKRK